MWWKLPQLPIPQVHSIMDRETARVLSLAHRTIRETKALVQRSKQQINAIEDRLLRLNRCCRLARAATTPEEFQAERRASES
jgi:hypothetical protein